MDALLNKVSIYLPIALALVILYLLFKRRLRQRFFWFLVYTAYQVLELTVRFSVIHQARLYYVVYWWTEIGEVALAVMAFRESFLNVFRSYARLRWFIAILWGCIGAALLYAFFKALAFPPVPLSPAWPIIVDLGVAINFTLGLVGILYFVLFSIFRIKGHRWDSGIISGFTIYVSIEICEFLITSIFGTRFKFLIKWLAPFGYILAQATWILELSRPEPPISAPDRNLGVDDLAKLEQYNTFLKRLWRRRP